MKINDVRINISASDSVEKVQSVSKEAAFAQQGHVRDADKAEQREKVEKVKETQKDDIVELHTDDRDESRRHRRRRREKNGKKAMFCDVYTKNKNVEYTDTKGHSIDIKG
jgi:hypothetical protein